MKLIKCSVALVLFCSLSSLAMAQDLGRANDGRAYRKSADGFQIKDHIAELEVTIDGLKRQVYALEDELKDKNQTISRLTGGKGVEKKAVKESNLVPYSARSTSPGVNGSQGSCGALQDKVNSLELTLKRINSVGATQVAVEHGQSQVRNCQLELQTARQNQSKANQKISTLSSQIARLQGALMEGPSEKTLENERVASGKLQQQLSKAKAELAAVATGAKDREGKMRELQQQVASAKEELSLKEKKVADLQQRFEKAEQEIAALQKREEQLLASRTSRAKTPSRGSMTPPRSAPKTVAAKKKNIVTSASLNKSKAALKTQLSSIQGLIIKRKTVLDKSKSKNQSVGIKIQPLKTKRGKSLDEIRVQVRRMSDPGMQFQLQSELAEIEAILEQDISVLSRLAKL